MNLYQIDQAILSLVDPKTGEILDWGALDALQMERDTKIENVALWIKNLNAEAKAIREEEISLADRRKANEKKIEHLKSYLTDALGGQKFQTARCQVSFRKTTKVELDPEKTQETILWAEQHGHAECVTYKAPDINKNELAKILKSGEAVPGAELVEGLSMGVK